MHEFKYEETESQVHLWGVAFIPVGVIEGGSSLRSVATGQLCVPRTKTDNRPARIRSSFSDCLEQYPSRSFDPNLNLSCFKKKLKTHLFKISSALWGSLTTYCDCALLAAFETFL